MPDPQQVTTVLLGTAASLAIFHTLIGVDHSLPFVAISRARGWSLSFTLLMTSVCGVAHVASSVMIGVVGLSLGISADSLLSLESSRGSLAAVLLISFGLTYAAWAFRSRTRRRNEAKHHAEFHGGSRASPWALFVVFALGPCEPLIPLMFVPGIARDWVAVGLIVAVFGILTIAVMLVTVTIGYIGIRQLSPFTMFRIRFNGDVVAGLIVAASGAAVFFLAI